MFPFQLPALLGQVISRVLGTPARIDVSDRADTLVQLADRVETALTLRDAPETLVLVWDALAD